MQSVTRCGFAAVLALGVGSLAIGGCAETELQGVLLDSDLNTEELLEPLVLGAIGELVDAYNSADPPTIRWPNTDDLVHDGTSAAEERRATGEYSDREDGDGIWAQAFEASWSGVRAVDRAISIFGEAEAAQNPLTARAWLVAGLAERVIGMYMCEAVVGFGPQGGNLISNLGQDPDFYDNSVVIGPDSIFRRVATYAELAATTAEAAIAAGAPPNSDNFGYLDPQRTATAAHGLAAQAYMSMASLGRDPVTNWAMAIQHAADVPTDFVEDIPFSNLVLDNPLWDGTWADDELTLWGRVDAGGNYWEGVPATALWPTDPRVDITRCGDLVDPLAPLGDTASVLNNDVQKCEDDLADDRQYYISEWGRSNDADAIPRWLPNQYDNPDENQIVVSGVEARLIEAEAALIGNNDLGTFYSRIDEVRTFYGAGPTAQPGGVGDFEWPNAEDDAMSILDRERYLTLWLTGTRFWDLNRWNHPWHDERHALLDRHRAQLTAAARFRCFPMPTEECNLNGFIQEASVCEIPAQAPGRDPHIG